MPTIKRFPNCAVSIYGEDHNPPHVHVRGAGFALLVDIGTGRIVGRTGKARDVSDALAWIKANTEALMTQWQELNP